MASLMPSWLSTAAAKHADNSVTYPGTYRGEQTLDDGSLLISSHVNDTDYTTVYIPQLQDATAMNVDNHTQNTTTSAASGNVTEASSASNASGRYLASYIIGPDADQDYRFYPNVPYTDKLLSAIESHVRLVKESSGADKTLLCRLEASLETTKLIRSVSDGFFENANSRERRGTGIRAAELTRIVMPLVDEASQLKMPFFPVKYRGKAVKYLVWALIDGGLVSPAMQKLWTKDSDLEKFIKNMLSYICICYDEMTEDEKAVYKFD
jgi:hypothetical protein